MEICATCGDIELLYVPACGDPDIGESNILLFAQQEKDDISAEIKTIENGFDDIEKAKKSNDVEMLIEAQDHMAKLLEYYIKPKADLPQKHLVQVYSLTAKKWTYVRSDKMKNHWRKMPIDKNESPRLDRRVNILSHAAVACSDC